MLKKKYNKKTYERESQERRLMNISLEDQKKYPSIFEIKDIDFELEDSKNGDE